MEAAALFSSEATFNELLMMTVTSPSDGGKINEYMRVDDHGPLGLLGQPGDVDAV